VQELEALGADDTGLNVVDMGVDETRSDEATGMVGKRALWRQFGLQLSEGSDRLDHTVAADHEAVRLAYARLVRIGEERIVAAEDQRPAHSDDGAVACRGAHRATLAERKRRAHRSIGGDDG